VKNIPFGRPGRFYRGNVHTHSNNSDGDLEPSDVCQRYQDAGYDFVCLSDHYLEKFGFPLTDSKNCRNEKFTTLIGAELHQGKISNGETWHVLAVGLPLDFAKPSPGETCAQITDRAAACGAFIGIVHPSWYALTPKDAEQIKTAHAIEIYNHGAQVVVDKGQDTAYLDMMLNGGRRLNAFASDDAHHLTIDAFGGWVHVLAKSLDPDEILSSLKAGHYYSSQGPQIKNIEIKNGEILVECSPAAFIGLHGRGHQSDQVMGQGLLNAKFSIKKYQESFVRVTIRDNFGKHAWSNPIWFD